jgi:hypothetical protein
MPRINPSLKDPAHPRKGDNQKQLHISQRLMSEAGGIRNKMAIAIPELRMTVYAEYGSDETAIRKKCMSRIKGMYSEPIQETEEDYECEE